MSITTIPFGAAHVVKPKGPSCTQIKPKKRPYESAAKAALVEAIHKATGATRTEHGPEPKRLKIEGDWKAAVGAALRKPKPPGGWPRH